MGAVTYRDANIADHYDSILIGSGIGALVTASCLSRTGQKVLVLEQHYAPGGYTHTFRRRNYEWDVGVHYIGEVLREQSFLAKLFRYVGDGSLAWADMGDVYDRIRFGDDIYDFCKGRLAWIEQMCTYFPSDKDVEAINQYVSLVNGVAREARSFFVEKALPPIASTVAGPWMRRKFAKYAGQTTLEVLRKLTDNPKLIAVLTGQYGDYGLPPGQSSFAMHALVVRHYFNGGAYPIGGSSRIFETIAPVIEETGGQIVTSARVSSISVRNRRAVGVEMSDGRTIEANHIVSGAGITITANQLLSSEDASRAGFSMIAEHTRPSASHLCLYLGFKGSPAALNLPKANWWYYPNTYDHDASVAKFLSDPSADLPVTYVSFPAAKDPSWGERYPDRSTVEVITLAPYEQFSPWSGTRWQKRGDDYQRLKDVWTERLLSNLYHLEPQLEGQLDFHELSTPLSTKHFSAYESGEIYGLDHTPERFGLRSLRPKTGLKGLFLTGQDISTAGVGGAMMGGLICASAMTGKRFAEEVMNL